MTPVTSKRLAPKPPNLLFFTIFLCYALKIIAEVDRNLTIRGGVLHAPPMAMIDDNKYSGFQIDLLEILKDFALEMDNINVTYHFTAAGSNYGKAIDIIAKDCNTTENPISLEDCLQFDFIVGDFYTSAERYSRVDFSPAWLPSRITTAKYNKKSGFDFNTLTETVKANAKVCIAENTLTWIVALQKFPDLNIYGCEHQSACINDLKAGHCVLYVEDELQLMYRAMNDMSLTVNREQFFTQYLVWPISSKIDPEISYLLKRWLYGAMGKAIPDDLYEIFFEKGVCPPGAAGENCELPCHPVNGQSNKMGICVCNSIRWDGDDCSNEILEDKNLIPKGFLIGGYVMFSINAVTIIGCGSWLWFKRNLPKVKLAQPSFLALVLVGCFISTSTIIPLGIESNGEWPVPACMTIPWFYSIGFSVTFGTLFSKIRRIHLIFKSASVCVRRTVTASETLKLIAIVLAIDILPLLVWNIFDPLVWKRKVLQEDQFGYPLSSIGFCTSDYWGYFTGTILCFHLVVVAVACYMCYVARSIPSQFSDVKYVTMAMISNLQILIVGLPVLILVGTDPTASYFVRTAIVWMNDFVVVALIFGNLMYQIYFNLDEELQISNAVTTYSRKSRRSQIGQTLKFVCEDFEREGTSTTNEHILSYDGESSHSGGIGLQKNINLTLDEEKEVGDLKLKVESSNSS